MLCGAYLLPSVFISRPPFQTHCPTFSLQVDSNDRIIQLITNQVSKLECNYVDITCIYGVPSMIDREILYKYDFLRPLVSSSFVTDVD